MNRNLAGAILTGSLLLVACGQPDKPANLAANDLNNQTNSANKPAQETSAETHRIEVKSENTFDETYAKLKTAIEANENLTIIEELDHAANAKKADMDLRPTKLILFGNPKLGTPLMKENQSIGIDLPQKFLVYQNENGEVFVVYNDPKHLAEDHKISGQDEITSKMSGALKMLADAAAKK